MSQSTSDESPTRFSDLGLKPEILKAIDEMGYTTPTPIQAQAIPHVLMARDVLGLAQTGTGKTAGFTLPMLEILSEGRAKARMPRSIILEPTRELAAQVAENFESYGKYVNLSYALLIGGSSMDEQIKALDRGVDVLIATPGRMIDLIERGRILLADVKILVIDEADRMLDMGFIPDIENIVRRLPVIRQTMLFSATMPAEIRRLADTFMMNPREVAVSPPATTADTVAQHLAIVDPADKRDLLRELLGAEDVKNALVFCNRKRDVTIVFRSLTKHGFDAGQLHGDMVQSLRTETLEQFRKGEVRILVCSDVAARGIDISDLSHVFNFDVPRNPDDYVHRIGRTGRAGRKGRAFTLATPEEGPQVQAILNRLSTPPETVTVDGLTLTLDALEEKGAGGRRGRRGPEKSGADGGRRRGRGPAKAPAPVRETEGEDRQDAVASSDTPAAEDPGKTETAGTDRRDRSDNRNRSETRSDKRDRTDNRGGDGRGTEKSTRTDGTRNDNGRNDGGRTDGSRNRRGGRDRDPDDRPVVGMGDHIPAFLLRPVRRDAA